MNRQPTLDQIELAQFRTAKLTTHLEGVLQIYYLREDRMNIRNTKARLLHERAYAKRLANLAIRWNFSHPVIYRAWRRTSNLTEHGYTDLGWSNSPMANERISRRACSHNPRVHRMSNSCVVTVCHACFTFYQTDDS